MKLVFNGRAIRDLQSIARWSQSSFGARQAKIYVANLEEKCGLLAEGILSGLAADEVTPGMRKLIVKSRIVFFRVYSDKLTVIRVLHGSQDVERHL